MAGRIPTSEIRKRMSETLDLLSEPDQWVIITRHGEAIAAMVSINMLWRLLEACEAETEARTCYALHGSTGATIETASARPPECKSGPVGTDLGAPDLPELDDLLRQIERLQTSLVAQRGAA